MFRLPRAIMVGTLLGFVGLVASITPLGLDLEERFGLDLLFRMRGERAPPKNVVIISLDRASANHLKLPAEPEKWPRILHAELTGKLAEQGAAVIVFDMLFREADATPHDHLFAKAIRDAGTVVLAERIVRETFPLNGEDGTQKGAVNIERLVRPMPLLAESALATAPFPLPKVPVKVSQYWTFKEGAGGTPTLPVVAFQVYAFQAHDELVQLLERVLPPPVEPLPIDKDPITRADGVINLTHTLRRTFIQEPSLAERIVEGLEKPIASDGGVERNQILAALVKMYDAPNSHYLNYYGPPGTIHTVPYVDMVRGQGGFKGKAVFIGLSERVRPQEQDAHYTVFSQSSGADISGVEVVATAFANLLEDMPVRPLSPGAHAASVFFWGMLLGIVCLMFSSVPSAAIVVGISTLYLAASELHFACQGRWYPLVIPVFFQAPLALFGTTLWRYSVTYRERKNMREAFGYFVPDRAVDELVDNVQGIKGRSKIVYGICLCTDIEGYTTVADKMDPKDLSFMMNEYFEAVFEPVRRRGGIVSDVKGDSMMAVWVAASPDAVLRNQACLAALDISSAVHRFNRTATYRFENLPDRVRLPTRIGLDAGLISFGTVGGGHHYEYRPVGAPVNTSERVEGLNKRLGTSILVSEDVLLQLEGFLSRELGKFLLMGKTRPVVVYELIGPVDDSSRRRKTLCVTFSEGLNLFKSRCWDEAAERFSRSLEIHRRDGPSLFYLRLCQQYLANPPGEEWDGLVQLDGK